MYLGELEAASRWHYVSIWHVVRVIHPGHSRLGYLVMTVYYGELLEYDKVLIYFCGTRTIDPYNYNHIVEPSVESST